MKRSLFKTVLFIILTGFGQRLYSQITFTINNPTSNFTLTCFVPITVYASSDYTDGVVNYTWTGSQQPTSYADSIGVMIPGVYTVVAGSGSLVSAPQTFTVFANTSSPTLSVSATANALTCNLTTIQLQATSSTPGVIYDWYYFSSQSGSVLSVSAPGIYTVIATNTVNGCTTAKLIFIQDNQLYPVINYMTNYTMSCAGNTVALATSAFGNMNSLTYSWNFPQGAIISGASTGTLVTNQPGQYQMTATNTLNGCSVNVTMDVWACVGIIENKKNMEVIEVYPNPVQDVLMFKSGRLIYGEYSLSIHNFFGQTIYQVEDFDLQKELDVSFLKTGIYFFRLQTEQGTQTVKIMKD